MARLPGNRPLLDDAGTPLNSILAINSLGREEKIRIYGALLPERLCCLLGFSRADIPRAVAGHLLSFAAPENLSFVRIEARVRPDDTDTVFFLELADSGYNQLEFCFCIICDPVAPRFNVDVDGQGRVNCFSSSGRNISEELRAMRAGLFPHQTRRGLRMFAELLLLVEQFADAMGMEMIVADLLTYCNAIRYEGYGFDYLSGLRLMHDIDTGFQPGGTYFNRLDGSNEFRMPGAERSVRGRSWAIYDGIMDEPWNNVRIYKMIGHRAEINTFPGRQG